MFPALILAAICVVLFTYIQQLWPIILGICIVIFGLAYDHFLTKSRIPNDWKKWDLADTRCPIERANIAIPIIIIMTGVMWILIALAIVIINWPTISWSGPINLIIGCLWIVWGIIGLQKNRKREIETDSEKEK